MNRIRTGLVVAAFTPFKKDFSVDYARIPDLINHYVSENIRGVFINGTTGEGVSLTREERMKIAEAYLTHAGGKLHIFVHVGHSSLEEARKLAVHAQEIGADAISAVMPHYFSIPKIETLVQSMAYIANAAPELPFYYYHIPALTQYRHDMYAFLEQAPDHFEHFGGIKFTSTELDTYLKCMQKGGKRYDLLFGYDELMLNALVAGAKGFIGSTYNFMAGYYHEMMAAFSNGDLEKARSCQLQAINVIRLIPKYGGLRMQKAMMQLIGIDLGPVRLPLANLSDEELSELESDMQKLDFQLQRV